MRYAFHCAVGLLAFATFGVIPVGVQAEPFPVAVFSGLDKITARVTKFQVQTNKPTRFGALEITVRACDKKPPEEPPQTAAYVEIRQVNEETHQVDPAPIFKGWMFAESPGLNALEHPVYDVWLNTCSAASAAAPAP